MIQININWKIVCLRSELDIFTTFNISLFDVLHKTLILTGLNGLQLREMNKKIKSH